MAFGLEYLSAPAALAAIMLTMTFLTNFASNATAATVGTPIAFAIAAKLDLPPEPLVLAVVFSVGCVALSLYLLPRLKGMIVGLQWAKRMHGFGGVR